MAEYDPNWGTVVVDREPGAPAFPSVPREAAQSGTLMGFLDHLMGVPTKGQITGDIGRGVYGPGESERLQQQQFTRQDEKAQRQNQASAEIMQKVAALKDTNPDMPPNMVLKSLFQDPTFLHGVMQHRPEDITKLVQDIASAAAAPKPVPVAEGTNLVSPDQINPGTGQLQTLYNANPKPHEGSFITHANAAIVKRHAQVLTDSDAAQQQSQNLQQLRAALQNAPEAGVSTTVRQYAQQRFGIHVGANATDIDVLNSLADRVAPSLRIAGSGSQSDIEFKAFKNSLPSLMQSRAGREIIFNNLQSLADKRVKAGDIAARRLNNVITEDQATAEYKKLWGPSASRRRYNPATGQLEDIE